MPYAAGIAEISKVVERLTATASTKTRRWIVPLHSSVSSAEQRQAFSKPPHGVRKIVIATNIAETSLTIADVCFVIDAGRLKVGQILSVSCAHATDLSKLVDISCMQWKMQHS